MPPSPKQVEVVPRLSERRWEYPMKIHLTREDFAKLPDCPEMVQRNPCFDATEGRRCLSGPYIELGIIANIANTRFGGLTEPVTSSQVNQSHTMVT
ncbi:uncharacterized protein RAG0_05867 [Rhynchosporium agropyri]|uniref:Uncharacterized protein n=1 Tax=Rhynchosporium agropyri TaxID=914238 RepID=A0A1E1KII4_9HELO|nr:uncharacterized protein RAG0_05867 [Rhynchosporium agropyri]